MTILKNEIVGTWRLLSYIEIPVGGQEYLFPMGKNPKGILIFNPDGYMSVQISVKDSIQYTTSDRFAESDETVAARAKQYIAFTGKYTVDNMLAQVSYHIETSLNPSLEGLEQLRKLDFEGDILYQKSLEPISSNGQMVHAYMTWQKITKHSLQEDRSEQDLLQAH